MTLVKIGTGSRILQPEGPFRVSFWGHISVSGQNIFTKFGGYIANELTQSVECSKHVPLADSGKAPYMQHIGVLEVYVCPRSNGLPKCVEWSKYDYLENPVWRTAAM